MKKNQQNSALLFLYDEYMIPSKQNEIDLNIEFISYGLCHAKMRWVNDTKRKRKFIVPPKKSTTNLIFGGIYFIEDWNLTKHKICALYNSSIAMLDKVMNEDLFLILPYEVTPVKFKNYKDIKRCTYETLEPIECFCFFGNFNNKKIVNSISKNYYRMKGYDSDSFIKSIIETTERKRTL